MLALSMKPNHTVHEYKQLIVNSYRFNIHNLTQNMATQNSNVMLNATTKYYASSRNLQPRTEDLNYYKIVKKMVILDYYSKKKVVLMKCD